MAIPVGIYVLLQKIILFAQAKKLDLLRGGRGLEEPTVSDEPQLEDMSPSAPAAPSANQVPPKLVHTDEGLPVPLTEPVLAAPASIKDIIEASDSEQLTLEEILMSADQAGKEKSDSPVSAMPPKGKDHLPKMEPPELIQEPPKLQDMCDDEKDVASKYSWKQRFHDWREARIKWKVEKWRKDYEYACKKQQIKDMCTGYDEIIAYVQRLMSDWDGILADDNIADMTNVSISGPDNIGV